MLFVGDDWAEAHHDVEIQDDTGRRVVRRRLPDVDDFNRELEASPHLFPDSYTRWGAINFMPPENLLHVDGALRDRGYPATAVAAILGGNFRRVAEQVWKTSHYAR